MTLSYTLMRLKVYKTALRIANEHGLTLLEAYGPRGRKWRPAASRARDNLLALLRWGTHMSLSEIGEVFGVDHKTVIVAVRRHEQRINGERT